MITVADVLSALKLFSDTEGFSEEKLTAFSESGLNYVESRLKDGVNEADPLILETACAVAHYNFFLGALSSSDRYENYKAGDMTIRRDIKKELQFEKEVLVAALAKAASILKDTEFCVIAG